jgi:hypothetical protein
MKKLKRNMVLAGLSLGMAGVAQGADFHACDDAFARSSG